MGNRRIWNALCSLGIAIALTFTLVGTALAEYTHGYFKYDVADGSVTITGYVGSDEVVTVPAMIAGNPVNVIGEGAFTSSFDIKKVRVHSSVINVEPGALAPGQMLEYIDNDGDGNTSGAEGDTQAGSDTQTEGDAQNGGDTQGAQDGTEVTTTNSTLNPLGIRLKNGSFITVDYDGNLLVADIKGNEYVLDDTQTYTREATEDGNVVIRNAAGEVVEVDPEAATVTYADMEGQQMKYDSLQNTIDITDEDGNVFTVETDMDKNVDVVEGKSKKQEKDGEQNGQSAQTQEAQQVHVALIVVALAIVLGVGGFFLWRSRHAANANEEQQEND